MQQVAFSTIARTRMSISCSYSLNVKKGETENISFTLNIKSDVFLFLIWFLLMNLLIYVTNFKSIKMVLFLRKDEVI